MNNDPKIPDHIVCMSGDYRDCAVFVHEDANQFCGHKLWDTGYTEKLAYLPHCESDDALLVNFAE